MNTATAEAVFSIAGISIPVAISRTAASQIGHHLSGASSLPAGNAGSLTTRTSDTVGVVTTTATGHGIVAEDLVDVYWTGGVRYGMAVTLVGGDGDKEITVDSGAGDNLPTQDTAVVITEQVEIDTDFDGDLLQMIVASADRRVHLDFLDGTTPTPVSLEAVELPAGGEGWWWIKNWGNYTNPLTGNPVDKVMASCGDADNAAVLKLALIYDSS